MLEIFDDFYNELNKWDKSNVKFWTIFIKYIKSEKMAFYFDKYLYKYMIHTHTHTHYEQFC